MGDIYEELTRIFGERLKDEGLSTMTLVTLPPSVRSVVQVLLRNKGEMAYPDLLKAVEAFPEGKRLSQAQLDEILEAMTRLDMTLRSEQKKTVIYKLILGKSTGGTRPQARSGEDTGEPVDQAAAVWDTLGEEEETETDDGLVDRFLGALGLKPDEDE